jgi:hypothetical protein
VEQQLTVARGLADCETSPCLRRAAELLRLKRLVLVQIEVFGSSYVFRLHQIGADGGSRISVQGRCDVCTLAEVNDQISQAALRLARTRPSPSEAAVPAGPAAATAGPYAASTPPASPASPEPSAPAPRLREERTSAPRLASAPAPSVMSRSESPPSLRLWKWSSLGVAVALVTVGVVLIAVDGQGACTPDATGACPRVYDTATSGWVLTTTGIAALGAAGALFWFDRPAVPRGTGHAALVGWRGRF